MANDVVKPEPDEANRAAIEQMLLHAYEFAVEQGLAPAVEAVELPAPALSVSTETEARAWLS